MVPRIDCQSLAGERSTTEKARTDHERVQNYSFQKQEFERPGLLRSRPYMGQVANRQSLVFSERGQLSQAIPQFHVE